MRPFLAALCVALLGSGPCSVLPGGRLEGELAAPPADWSFVGDDASCQIEVGSAEPRSLNVGCYAYERSLYVHSHRWADAPRLFGESWPAMVLREPDVRVAVQSRIYALRARLVAEASARREILATQGFDPPPDGIYLFQLGPRSGEE